MKRTIDRKIHEKRRYTEKMIKVSGQMIGLKSVTQKEVTVTKSLRGCMC